MRKLALVIAILFIATSCSAATKYVRQSGGTRVQCTGLADVAYDGSGSGEACAYNHPSEVLGTHANCGNDSRQYSGSDTVMITDEGAGFCTGCGCGTFSSCATVGSGAVDCTYLPILDGTVVSPTKIYGSNYASCSADASKAELWGKEKAYSVLSLTNSDNVEVKCLEITDHDDCSVNGIADNACDNTYPFGDWAQMGVHAHTSNNIVWDEVNIHGLASAGIWASRVGSWTMTNFDLNFNAFVGWDGDNGSWADDSFTGTITIGTTSVTARDGINIKYSGCAENYPTNGSPIYCSSQDHGGFGDAIGLGDGNVGNWIIRNSDISHNTSDAADLLHGNGTGNLTYIRTRMEGNAGNQMKGTALNYTVENSKIIGNCNYFSGQTFTATPLQDDPNIGAKSQCGAILSNTEFTGTGKDDATAGGTRTSGTQWEIIVDSVGATDTFKWRRRDNNGVWGAYTTLVNMQTSAYSMTGGPTIKWISTTGHTLNDKWNIYYEGGRRYGVRFTGTGLEDAVSGGTFNGDRTGTSNHVWTAIIDSVNPDMFKWKKNSGSYSAALPVAITPTTISEGVTIKWNLATGHTVGDLWTFGTMGCFFNHCRSAGGAIDLRLAANSKFNMFNTTVYSNGDTIFLACCNSCNTGTEFNVKNSLVFAGNDFTGTDKPDLYYESTPGESGGTGCTATGYGNFTQNFTKNLIYNIKDNADCTLGGGNICSTNPGLSAYPSMPNSISVEEADVSLASNSPARYPNNAISADTTVPVSDAYDYYGTSKGSNWDLGAKEYEEEQPSPCDTGCSFCLNQSTCQASAEGCFWWTDSICRSTKQPVCGDSVIDSGEGCDDGGTAACTNSCSATCTIEVCGNGVTECTEACDSGIAEGNATCTSTCTVQAICGDGSVNASNESCDDGNVVSEDGCSATCQVETCGNGVIDAGELCDGGEQCGANCKNVSMRVDVGDGPGIFNFRLSIEDIRVDKEE